MLTVEAITSFDDFRKTGSFWNSLVSRSDNDTPFSSFEWFSFFWTCFCGHSAPLILVLREGGEPAAIVPLIREKVRWRKLPVTRLSFMANYFSIRAGIIAPREGCPEIFEHVFRFLKGSGTRYDIFVADMVVKGSLTDTMLYRYCGQRELVCRSMPGDCNPYVRVQGSWDDYLASRSKHQRYNVRHLAKVYERGVRHTITTYTNARLDEAVEKMFFISRNSWKFRNGTAICNDGMKMDFYSGFLRVAAAAGWLRLKVLEIDGIPAAFSYEIRYRDTAYILKIGYNDAFKKLAPGVYLMNCSIRDAFETGVAECELLGESEEWKLKMCDHCREHVKHWVFSDSPYGRLLHAWENRIVATAKLLVPKAPAR